MDAVGRVPHWSPMRGVASDAAACTLVPRLSFFFFTYSRWLGSICANLASICAEPGWFGQNQAVLAESSCFGRRPKRPKQAEIGLESEIGFGWGPNNLNLSFLNFILNIFLLLLCFLFCLLLSLFCESRHSNVFFKNILIVKLCRKYK